MTFSFTIFIVVNEGLCCTGLKYRDEAIVASHTCTLATAMSKTHLSLLHK